MTTEERRRGLFVTGTDTDVGKTVVSRGLMHALRASGLPVRGFKPVAAGCERTAHGLRNGDALALQRLSDGSPAYHVTNPVALEPAIAPHLAAAQIGTQLRAADLADHIRANALAGEGVNLVEGAGGWLVPLNRRETLADLAHCLGYPVILVVAIRLGCINHSLLSAAAIRDSGLSLAGWIANCTAAETPLLDEQVDAIRERLGAPLLGRIGFAADPTPATVAAQLDHDALGGLFA
ncbi:dethiobiotin synthase [Methylonatrum kenyense]|uniref:dethiobiotin synthase n=1 Tax=Methylonatrum kenyense TaxID=455253 RepID=UPI0020C03625|nr:dethiobiotin synthase [Methylonatrum kenyense]MCK8516912.1 dethiobiotin synthase [Methylonatrum kenyense]